MSIQRYPRILFIRLLWSVLRINFRLASPRSSDSIRPLKSPWKAARVRRGRGDMRTTFPRFYDPVVRYNRACPWQGALRGSAERRRKTKRYWRWSYRKGRCRNVLLTRLASRRVDRGNLELRWDLVSLFFFSSSSALGRGYCAVSFVALRQRDAFLPRLRQRQASLPRDRRNPLPSFRDDIKRVLMSIQLWSQ